DEYVALVAICLHLAFEQLFVAVIVSDRCKNRRISGECDCSQPWAVECEPADELAGDVLRIGCAATVASQQNLAFVAQACDAGLCCACQGSLQCGVGGQGVHDAACLGDLRLNVGLYQILHAWLPFLVKWQLLACPSNWASVRRTSMRRSGGTKNIMKPPPPAPETLPALAPASMAAL